MTIKMDELAGSGNDEFYTPKYAVMPILKYIKPNSTVWCPFDTEDSWFVKLLSQNGHKVIMSHINEGQDFFKYRPDKDFDYIISNPPYSMKNEVLSQCFHYGKPFALLLGVVGLFEGQVRTKMFRENRFEVLYLTSRVEYFESYSDQKPSKSPPFQSVYICSQMLPEQIVFSDIDKKDISKDTQITLDFTSG